MRPISCCEAKELTAPKLQLTALWGLQTKPPPPPPPASLLWGFTETSDCKASMPQTTTIFMPKPASPPILLWCNNNSPCLLNTCYVPSMVLKVPAITSFWIITKGSHKTGIIVSTLIFQVRKLRHRVTTQLMGGIVRISVQAESWVLDLPILPSDQPPSCLDWWLCTQHLHYKTCNTTLGFFQPLLPSSS